MQKHLIYEMLFWFYKVFLFLDFYSSILPYLKVFLLKSQKVLILTLITLFTSIKINVCFIELRMEFLPFLSE
jgi:hypothetical protein